MVDIIFGDRLKKVFEWSRFRIISDYDIDCEITPSLQYVGDVVDFMCDNTRHGHQRQRMRNYKDIMIWAVLKKHIAVSVVYDLLYNIGNDELRDMITTDMRIPRKPKWGDKALHKFVLYALKMMYDDKYCNPKTIHSDLIFSGNDSVRHVHGVLLDVLAEHRHEKLTEVMEFFLWVLVKDTGYRDQFFWLLNEIGNQGIQNMVKDYVKPPSKWAPNAWLASKDTTAEAHRTHLIPKTTLSYAEKVNVPSYQKKQLERFAGAKIRR